ncbi:GPI inositol-deacylase [Seminavis robusta]|uniref:GPI inositol-deacylase n=1 Tax=Seminavis robusta TaxID=568900 RepID=A0A9N8HTC3_9STRA|nr:GPI inositol-deacylase [Seminavis robusta]|eukprot:Sro1642_g288040.1 GPI inositol-deacylase (790) ;mRNA; r:12507-15074
MTTSNLRRRRLSGEDAKTVNKNDERDDGGGGDETADANKKVSSSQPPIIMRPSSVVLHWLLLLCHVIAVGIFVWGWILRQELHTSVECDMTYSQRQLIPIHMELPTNNHTQKYGLYKFIDQRDPRSHHRAMMQRWLKTIRVTGEDDLEYRATKLYQQDNQEFLQHNNAHHCTPKNLYNGRNDTDTTVAVLYIPGHWGSYMQSRSIGAHGIQLTGARSMAQQSRVLQALTQNTWKGTDATDSSQFVFDVYAMDFSEEGAALHAQFLWAQTAFVAKAIQHIVDTCQLSQVIVLGHSIGGYVSRLAPILYPNIRPYIANIVTLGSPHAHPVFGWESSIHQLHQTYLENSNNDNYQAALVAISGGLRDEMIPPVACRATTNALSILATQVMKPATDKVQPPTLGMDHRAIVWCHNLLSVVREVFYTLVQQRDNKEPQERIAAVQEYLGLQTTTNDKEGYSFQESLEEHQSVFMQHYGYGATIAMESAMLYHLEVLVGLFVVLGCFQCAGIGCLYLGHPNPTIQWRMQVVPLLATICLAARTNYQLHWLSLVVLTLVANTVLWGLQWILAVALARLPRTATPLSKTASRIRWFALGIFFLLFGLQCVGKLFAWKTRLSIGLLFAVYFATMASAVAFAASSRRTNPPTFVLRDDARLVAFAATFFLACPCLVAGKFMALIATIGNEGIVPTDIPEEYLPDTGLGDLTTKLLLPIVMRLGWMHVVQKRPESSATDEKRVVPPSFLDFARALLMTLAILSYARSLFQIGQGYRAGDLLVAICWLECFIHSLFVKLMD